MTEKRNGALCIWAFIFGMIFILHYAYFFDLKNADTGTFFFYRGELAIDFFFIAAGAFFAKTVNSVPEARPFSWRDYGGFLKRLLRLYLPAFVICWAATFILVNRMCFVSAEITLNNFLTSLLELLPLRAFGFIASPEGAKTFVGYRVMDQAWVISAIFVALALLYPLYLSNRRRFEHYIAPVGAILLLCFLYFRVQTLGGDNLLLLDPKPKRLYYFSIGTVKAFGEILAGVTCYAVARSLNQKTISKAKSHLLSVLEIGCYLSAIAYMQFMLRFELPKMFDYIALGMMIIGVTLSLTRKSSVSKLCDNKLFYFLGRFILYPFLTFMMFAKTLLYFLPHMGPRKLTLIYMALTLVSAVIVMLLEKPFVRLVRSMKRLFVSPRTKPGKETA